MPKTLHANGNSGRVYIYKGDEDPSLFATPSGPQLGDLYFHSDLSYLGNSLSIESSITHPQRTRSSDESKGFLGIGGSTYYNPIQGNQTYLIGSHSFGKIVPFVVMYEGMQIPSGTVIHQIGQSVRAISVFMDQSNVWLYESFVTFDDTLPAISKSYKIFLFDTLFQGSGNESIRIEPDLFRAGFGKLSSDYRYIRRDELNSDFRTTAGKTADVQGGGLKVVLPGGSVAYQSSTYTGSFTGSSSKGVKI